MPFVLTDEFAKQTLAKKRLPAPDEQEESLIRAVGDALSVGEMHLAVDLRNLASLVGAPNEGILRQLVVGLQRNGLLTGFQNALMVESGEINELQLGLTPDGFRKYRELKSRAILQSSAGRVVFLSHAAFDREVALFLKGEIERRLLGVAVFCSSDPTDLPPGSKWSPEIQRALEESSMLLLLASDHGLERPWVWFECGTFWFSGRKILPLCLGQVRKNALRPPLSELQAVNADDTNDLKVALDCLATETGPALADVSDLDTLAARLKKLDRDATAVARLSTGWLGAEWNGKFLAYEGPYEALRLIEDANFESSMEKALVAAGYSVALYDAEHLKRSLGDDGRIVQLTDRRNYRRRIAGGRVAHCAT